MLPIIEGIEAVIGYYTSSYQGSDASYYSLYYQKYTESVSSEFIIKGVSSVEYNLINSEISNAYCVTQ